MAAPPEDPAPEEEPRTHRLARAAKAGDAARFGELYEHVAPAIYAWAELRIRPGVRAWLDPQDVVQEVWCRAWRIFDRYDPEQVSFRYWVFRVAKNVLLEAFRKLRAPGVGGPDAGTTTRLLALREVPDDATGVSRRVARDETLRLFTDWVRELPEDDRKLLVHAGLEGMSHAEVAERLQLGREAVAKRWQRLRARIEQQKLPRALVALEDGAA